MEVFTIKELEKIISDGDLDSLIGKIENEFFDCKSRIYDLKSEYSKRELAKDVSSFANLSGGYILIGFKTKESESHPGEEIEEARPFQQDLVDVNQYSNIIKDWIYPEIEGIKVYWKEYKNESSKGIVIIEVPHQKDISKPFLVKKVVEEKKNREIIFGYIERRGDKSDPKKISDIHKIIRDGMLYDENIKGRFDSLEIKTEKIYARIGEPKAPWERTFGRGVFGGLSPQTLSEEIEQIIEEKLGRRANNSDYEPNL